MNQLIVELDAAMIVYFLKENVVTSHPYVILAQDCITLIQEGWLRDIHHIFRESNMYAHFLANLAQHCLLGKTSLSNPPIDLSPLLIKDILSTPSLRS